MSSDQKTLEAEYLALIEEANRDSEEASREEDGRVKRRAELFHFHEQRIFDFKCELPKDNKHTTA